MRRFRPGLVPTAAMLVAVALLASLGFWQLERLEWKRELLAERRALMEAPPIPLEEALAAEARGEAPLVYRRVRARGVYDAERSVVVLNVSRGLRSGARVLTPLRLAAGAAGPADAVLVDRGFVPHDELEAFLERDRRAPRSARELVGLAFPLELGDAEPGTRAEPRRRFQTFRPDRDAARLQTQLPYRLAPLLLQRGEGEPGELPLGGFAEPRSRVDHRSYAITWFGMAAAAFLVWVGWGVQRGRRLRGPR